MEKITVGADPEVFIKDSMGTIVSAIGMIPGDKLNPCVLSNAPGAVQVDNVLAEYNINPAETEDEFVYNNRQVLASLKAMLPVGYDFAIQASHEYSLDYLFTLDPACFVFGCDVDYDAWTMKRKNMPRGVDPALRSAGGHIHVGYDVTKHASHDVIRAMDYLIGLPSVLMETDVKRRQLYGQAGAYRPKKYGVEYRTPSNFWLHSEERMRWVYRQSVRAVKETEHLEEWMKILPPPALIDIINSSNQKEAEKYIANWA